MAHLPLVPHLAGAACRNLDPNLFHPHRGESAEPARAICRVCPACDPCRQFALDAPATLQGVRGATTPQERRRLRRKEPRVTDLLAEATNGLANGHSIAIEDAALEESVRTCSQCSAPPRTWQLDVRDRSTPPPTEPR